MSMQIRSYWMTKYYSKEQGRGVGVPGFSKPNQPQGIVVTSQQFNVAFVKFLFVYERGTGFHCTSAKQKS